MSGWDQVSFEVVIDMKAQGATAPLIRAHLLTLGYDFSPRAIRMKLLRSRKGEKPFKVKEPKVKVFNQPWVDDAADEHSVAMLDHKGHQCIWPVAGKLYCGRVKDGRSYCRAHMERAYRN